MKTIFVITLSFLFVSFLLDTSAQDYTQLSLPEGAKARFGKGFMEDIAYAPDGKTLAVATGAGIWLYDTHTGTEVALLSGDIGLIRAVAFSPDGTTLASGGGFREDYTIRLWDSSTKKQKAVLSGHTSNVRSLAFSPDGDTLASGDSDGTVRLWDIMKEQLKRTLSGHTGGNLFGCVFSR